MARFRYRMQSILDIKTKLETQAKQEFAAAKNALDVEKEKLAALKIRKSGYEQKAEKLLKGSLMVQEIVDNKSAILKMDEYINAQMLQIKVAENKLEVVRERLRIVMQERKMHEKLKERAFDEFLAEEKREEGKEVDQLTSYTYGQRILENVGSNADID